MRQWLGIVALLLGSSGPGALACSCGGGLTPDCRTPTADTIVLATVVSIESKQDIYMSGTEPWGSEKVTLRVSDRFRGNALELLVVRTASNSTCGYLFEIGHEYLVFANEFQGNLVVTVCSATQPARAAASRIRQLRAARDGTALPDLFGFVGRHPEERGVMADEQVQPVSGLVVTARSDAHEYRVKTAEDGTYAFRRLPHGTYKMSVKAPPGRHALWHGAEIMSTGVGSGCPVDFEIHY